jgi:hypothetical protein
MEQTILEKSKEMDGAPHLDRKTIDTLNSIAKVDSERKLLEDLFQEETKFFKVVNKILIKNYNLFRAMLLISQTLQQDYKKMINCKI